MNDDLHAAFSRAADDAADQAMTADQIRRAATERIRARRRRRPAFVVGSAVAGLALVGGGAFAAVQLSGDDRGELPDVIGSPLPTPQDSQTPEETPAPPSEEPSEAAPAPVEAEEPEPAPAPPATLPVADPDAVFPACGAVVAPPSGSPELTFSPSWVEGAVGDTVSASFWNSSDDDLAGVASTHLTAVAVKDGVVVGWTELAPQASTTPFDLDQTTMDEVETTGALAHTLCTDGTTPLPAGRYSVWVAQQVTITERVPYDSSYVAGAPVATDEDLVVSNDVLSLWMDGEGRSVPHPGIAAGWPAQVSQTEAFRTAEGPEETVVWLAVSDREYLMDLDPTLYLPGSRVLDLGYLEPDIPFKCQSEAPGILGLPGLAQGSPGSGMGVIFATRADADLFASQWEALHGPVVGIVTSAVWCHFS